ncbi:MFS transporter [Nocardia sp. NPDC059240]|uniref:MFS transporter n=1 Tax=Nocardia sp. NPDC059240 TaxID=3346786 RepID=UPI0036742FA0
MTVRTPGLAEDADSTARPAGAWIALAACLIAVFMQMLDLTIVHTAMPALARELHASGSAELSIVSVYGLAFACTLPTAARIGDLFGRHVVFPIALAAFAAASVLCGLSSGATELVLARGAAGVAAALASAQTIAIITGAFPERGRARAFGVYSAVAALAGMAGPMLGGALVDGDPLGLGWRAVFLINVPLAAVAVALANRHPEASRRPATWRAQPANDARHVGNPGRMLRRLDLPGVTLSATGLGLLVYPLAVGREKGWPPVMFVLLALSVPTLAVFGWQQRRRAKRGAEPLVRVELFGERGFAVGAVLTPMFYGVFTALLFTVSVAAQSGLGWSASRTGLVMLPFAVGAVAGALSSPVLVSLWGSRALTVGALVFAVALGATADTIHTDLSGLDLRDLAWPVYAAGAGMGWFAAPLPAVMMSAVAEPATGSASGIVPTLQQVGSSVGVAALGMVFFARVDARSYLDAIITVLWLMAGLSALLAVLTLALPRRRP